jgi:hypothetical protein
MAIDKDSLAQFERQKELADAVIAAAEQLNDAVIAAQAEGLNASVFVAERSQHVHATVFRQIAPEPEDPETL